MALKVPSSLGKILYGALFILVLPVALIGWTYGARTNVSLPALSSPAWGGATIAAGFLLWMAGVLALHFKGGGLPMNAFPPPRLVTGGVYALIAHPIYVGFTLMLFGAGLAAGSAALLWLVAPVMGLASAALWWGYERMDLHHRLGAPVRAAWLGVPLATSDLPFLMERLGALSLSLLVPAMAELALHGAGFSPSSISIADIRIPACIATLISAALASRSCAGLRDMVLTSWTGSLSLALFMLLLPANFFAGPNPIQAEAALLALSFMIGLATLLKSLSWIPRAVALAAAPGAGIFLAGNGGWPSGESIFGATVYLLAAVRWPLWRAALHLCEAIANCWKESDFGPVRIIHIGWLVALPALGAAAGAVVLDGPGSAAMVVSAIAFIIVGSALWAQLIEGSPSLSRPYGFFGGVLAIVLFALLAAPLTFGTSRWLVLATFAAVAPWGQGFARLRCFANGCCHGAPCPASCGVVYRNPRTRVVRLVNLGGVPIHPTQLYSLTGNILIGALLLRLWIEGARLALITGLYFALMGLARFVEEAWRGEPQTPVYAGLRLYQWVSIGCLAGGAALTAIPGSPPAPAPAWSPEALTAGLFAGILVWLVASVDFPRSRRRFSRLA